MATNETPEQREARLARRREQYRQRHAAETADAREARLERQRESARRRRAMESASDRNARLSQARRHQCKRVSTETSGERETRLQRLRAAQQLRLAAESPEERESRLAQLRLSQQHEWLKLSSCKTHIMQHYLIACFPHIMFSTTFDHPQTMHATSYSKSHSTKVAPARQTMIYIRLVKMISIESVIVL